MVPHHLALMIICHNQVTVLILLCVPVKASENLIQNILR